MGDIEIISCRNMVKNGSYSNEFVCRTPHVYLSQSKWDKGTGLLSHLPACFSIEWLLIRWDSSPVPQPPHPALT